MPKTHDRTCALPGCHGLVTRPNSLYCCPDHTRAGRNLANIRSRAAAAERRVLQDALDGKLAPPAHHGYLTTTDGVVLTGQAVVELRAAASDLRVAAHAVEEAITTPGVTFMGLRSRYKAVGVAAMTAAAAVEQVLRPARD